MIAFKPAGITPGIHQDFVLRPTTSFISLFAALIFALLLHSQGGQTATYFLQRFLRHRVGIRNIRHGGIFSRDPELPPRVSRNPFKNAGIALKTSTR